MFDPGPSGLGFYSLLADNLQNLCIEAEFEAEKRQTTCKTCYRYAVEEQRGIRSIADKLHSSDVGEKRNVQTP